MQRVYQVDDEVKIRRFCGFTLMAAIVGRKLPPMPPHTKEESTIKKETTMF
jgi:hypothetical protein